MKKIVAVAIISCLFSVAAFAEDAVYLKPKRQSNVRSDSTTGADILTVVSPDVVLEATLAAYDWYKVKLPPQTPAYVASQYINDRGECTVTKLNIRKEPSTTGAIIGKIQQGDVVAVMERNGEWTRINAYPYAQGWISMQQVAKTDRAAFDGYLASLPAIRSLAAPVAKVVDVPVNAPAAEQAPAARSEAVPVAKTVAVEKSAVVAKVAPVEQKASPAAAPVLDEKAARKAKAEAEKAERKKKDEEAKKAREEQRREDQEAKEAARRQRDQEREEQRMKEKVAAEAPRQVTAAPQQVPAGQEAAQKKAASPDAWDNEFKALLEHHNTLKKRISAVMDDNAAATSEPVAQEQKTEPTKPAAPRVDPASYADAKMVGTIMKTRKRSIPANAMLKAKEGEQMLVFIPENVASLFGKQVAVWGTEVTKDGYTYLAVTRVKIVE